MSVFGIFFHFQVNVQFFWFCVQVAVILFWLVFSIPCSVDGIVFWFFPSGSGLMSYPFL